MGLFGSVSCLPVDDTSDKPLKSVSASDYHPQLAVGSADGSCTTTNTLKSTRRGGTVVRLMQSNVVALTNTYSQPFLVHKIYQLDHSRKTGEFRMLEHFLPQVGHTQAPHITYTHSRPLRKCKKKRPLSKASRKKKTSQTQSPKGAPPTPACGLLRSACTASCGTTAMASEAHHCWPLRLRRDFVAWTG